MKLNYIDYEQLPVSIMFVGDEIQIICEFLKLHSKSIDDFHRPFALQQIANTFHEVNQKLIGEKS